MKALQAILFAVGIVIFTFTAHAQRGVNEYYAQCLDFYAKGAIDPAQSACQLALSVDPNHLPSLKLLARSYLDREQTVEANGFLEQANSLAPTDPEVQFLNAKSNLLRGNFNEALGLLPNITSNEVLLVRGQALEQLGRYEEALRAYREVPDAAEARLGVARILELLRRPADGLGLLGNTPRERLADARLLWLSGKPQEAARVLEGVLPRFGPSDADYTKTLGLLANVYYGLGDFEKGGLVLRQLSARTSLPSALLIKVWPWILVFLVFLGLVLYGESRIEPMRTVEMTSERRYGPGSLYVWLLIAVVVAGLVALVLGQVLYQNLLAIFTPVQGEVVRPIFYLLLGLVAFLITMLRVGRERLNAVLGPRSSWSEGVWAGVVLLMILAVYALVGRPLELSHLSLIYPVFFGLALLELVIRGVGSTLIQERYRDLGTFMTPLVLAVFIPGPTLFFLLASVFLGWLYKRTGGATAGAIAWVILGIIVAVIGSLPVVRTLMG
jgi:hypothetical protein